MAQAILAPGRHVFIYGERGVGKTSLAKTAGISNASNRDCFKQIGCSRNSTFDDLIRLLIGVFKPERLATVEKHLGFGINAWLSASASITTISNAPSSISVSRAADILASLDEDGTNQQRVVVIDEIDRLGGEVKAEFAELVKLLGDRGSRLTLIFTGVGADLREVLGSHASSFRQLAQVPLERLGYQSALDIVDDALDRFGLDWELEPTRTARFRIASIANGFPYYVHLLAEKLIYQVYEDKSADMVELAHLQAAISDAVRDAQEEIKKPYDLATRARPVNYKLAAWAAADSWDLERSAGGMYASYTRFCEKLGHAPIASRSFHNVITSLKDAKYGPLLKRGFRVGQYVFCENIARGYVRLCAESEGIELDDLAPHAPPAVTAFGREKRYIDPRRVGGPPRTFAR